MDEASSWMNLGMEHFRAGRSQEAASAFVRAVDLDPVSVDAHLLLALSLGQQYGPEESPANNVLESRIEVALRGAVELDAGNWSALIFLAHHLLGSERVDEGREALRQALELEPDHARVRFAVARISLDIGEFERVLSVDPLNDAAMEYIASLLRESGDLPEAERWLHSAADARSEKVQRAIASGGQPSRARDASGLLREWAEAMLTPLPPSVPPPPPDPRLAFPEGSPAFVSFDPVPEDPHASRPVRVHSNDQARKLIRCVEPLIHGDAFPDSELRFVVVIGADGLISTDVPISGNPWLHRFGRDALRQWLYRPTLIDDNPVSVVTEVRVRVHNGPVTAAAEASEHGDA